MQIKHRCALPTSNGQFWTSSDELEKVSALGRVKFAHSLQKVSYALAVHVEAMISFDGIHESWNGISTVSLVE